MINQIDKELLKACVLNPWSVTPRMMLVDSMIESGWTETKALETFEPPTLSQYLPLTYGVGRGNSGIGNGIGNGGGDGSGSLGHISGNGNDDGDGSGIIIGLGRGIGYGNINGYGYSNRNSNGYRLEQQ